jgi:hypothetical protein
VEHISGAHLNKRLPTLPQKIRIFSWKAFQEQTL